MPADPDHAGSADDLVGLGVAGDVFTQKYGDRRSGTVSPLSGNGDVMLH